MPKTNFLLAIAVVSALSFFTACTSYGPAFSHQRITYMERPFGDSVNAQVYASGQFGSDATYLPGESSQNGALGVHVGLNAYIIQFTAGVFGFAGKYTDAQKATYDYNGIGFRLHQNWKIPVNENVEIQILGYGYAFNSENGKYSNLRVRSRDSIGTIKDLGMFSLTTGVRYRTPSRAVLGFQYAYGTNAFFILPINASHCLSFSGGFKNTTVALNLSIPQRGSDSFKAGLHSTISLGITQALTRNGFL